MDINQRIIRDQDILTIYAIKINDNKAVMLSEKYSEQPEISYSSIGKYILSQDEILDNLSVNNLFNLLFLVGRDDIEIKEKLLSRLKVKIEKEKFFCADVDTELFLMPIHSSDSSFNKLDSETLELLKNNLKARINKIDDPILKDIIFDKMRIPDVANFLYYYEKGDFTKEKLDVLKEMSNKSENGLYYINFGLFQDDIFSMGHEFINYISKFPALSNELVILHKNNPGLFNVINNRIKEYDSFSDNLHEIEAMISSFAKICNEVTITDIEKQTENELAELAVLNCSAKGDSKFIKVEYTKDFQSSLNHKYDQEYSLLDEKQQKLLEKIKRNEEKLALINPDEKDPMKKLSDRMVKDDLEFSKKMYEELIQKKKNIYMNKRFSMSLEMAKQFLDEYSKDIEGINYPEDKKKIFYELKAVLEMDNLEENIDELYRSCTKEYKLTDILKIKADIAREFAKDYFSSMNKLDEKVNKTLAEGNPEYVEYIPVGEKTVKQIKLDGEFNMLVHSTGAGFVNTREIAQDTNFAKQWGTGKDKANHMVSTSYINQDFLGCAPVNSNGVLYAFTSQNSEAIKLMGATDINTYMREFAYDSKTKQYMSAKTMPYSSRRVYNEFALERKSTMPDYVILFDDMSDEVKNNTYKAAADFNIPILYIDKNQIKNQQLKNLDSLIESFKDDKNPETLKKLINTYETNVAGWLLNRSAEKDTTFTSSIDNTRFKDDFRNKWEEIHGVINDYLEEIKENNNVGNAEDLVRIATIILEEQDLYEESEKVGPITKTHLSFDAGEILQEVNEVFDELGISEMKVDIGNMPKAEKYAKITMEKIAENALKNAKLTDLDVESVRNVRLDKNRTGEINNGEL